MTSNDATKSRRRAGLQLLVGAAVLVLVLVGIGIALITAGVGPFASDEKKIEEAIRDYIEALNSEGPRGAVATTCQADREQYDRQPVAEREKLDKARYRMRVDAVVVTDITGDQASARVSGQFEVENDGQVTKLGNGSTTRLYFAKEDGRWKYCASVGFSR
ncbi:hypothetical protein [Nocardia cyriacigeorgica]|uniref:Rv0361 family membrane protein n=1 Tax=Nocardia cyriacigeorgica TaxID=135487 RepID=UPI0018936AB6|nr:hypothetical protein [Nocardia cyriacigeorgica]MBF6454710.1 hypothetical protein [Nocardia cyriacigeorgica]MBF6480211.1 hypothetical protein [Nocardia cyriacigeorgica]MBF6552604.1 hypothetical protein [Nocardia cyriacigeorgica]